MLCCNSDRNMISFMVTLVGNETTWYYWEAIRNSA